LGGFLDFRQIAGSRMVGGQGSAGEVGISGYCRQEIIKVVGNTPR
jgi:hypothetical protein